jgi:hypothetical protein
MGDRASVFITSESMPNPIELYGQWAGLDGVRAIANVLERTGRIGDHSYLTAQVFYEFAIILGDYTGNLGYGIRSSSNTENGWNDNPDITLNADTGSVWYKGKIYTRTEFIEFAKVKD